ELAISVGEPWAHLGRSWDNLRNVFRSVIRRCVVVLVAWLPLFLFWVMSAVSYSHDRLSAILLGSLISMGSAGLLGIAVWHVCQRYQWPVGFSLKFYLLQVSFALTYATAWLAAIYAIEFLRLGKPVPGFWTWSSFSRQLTVGIWL